MTSRELHTDAFLKRLRAGVAVSALFLAANSGFSASAIAQDTNVDDEELEEVVVTGSRIKRDSNLAGSAPVATTSAEDFRQSGEIDISEILNDQPALLASVSAENSIDSIFFSGFNGTTAIGQSVLQLRGLGPARTLVLVNGRRHVSGVSGTQSVDIGSIPPALIERVETLTGGASSVYGADAVTGVINFVLKDDFEGFTGDIQGSISDEGDAERYRVSLLYGQNFADGRGNFTVAVDYSKAEELKAGARDFTVDQRQASSGFPNPALRFQSGDISAANTPNFAQFFNPAQGRFSRGFVIPNQADFIASFTDEFGAAPNLTAAEVALFDQAAGAPPLAVLPQLAFSVTSTFGVIAPADFSSPDVDTDGNGTPDCLDSFTGFNSSFDFSGAFGFAGGCFLNAPGGIRPVRDGLIVGNFNQFGGDGVLAGANQASLLPEDEKYSINVTGDYDLTDNVRLFGEAKFVRQKTSFDGATTLFTDLLTIQPDNPFIPAELQQLATDAGGLFVTIDPVLGPNIDRNERETYRFVGGVDGTFDNGWEFELSANYGRFEQTNTEAAAVIMDRFFAAIDVTTDASGNPICRSDIDPTPPATTPFGIPAGSPGFFTFNPGDGSCRPLNIFGAAQGGFSDEAFDFVTDTIESEFEQEQFVLSGFIAGNTEEWLNLPGGAIGFVLGAEYRYESSSNTFDPLALGIAPVTTPNINAGESVGGNPDFAQESLINAPNNFDSGALVLNADGSYDVYELFGEISLPILSGETFAEELRLDASARFSDYSTVGSTFVWNAGLVWAPVSDISFRGSYSKSVRAPNINELFAPSQAGFFRPIDPCAQEQIDALQAAGDARASTREANCRADGLPEGFVDPLSARFAGSITGNEDLTEETAETFTIGTIIQPNFLEGFNLTVDYWDIRIEDAIALVAAQDIVDGCYDSSNFPNNQFCSQFTRNDDTTSPQFGGFTFLQQTQLNFAALEAAGIDFAANYAFNIEDHAFRLNVSGSWFDKINRFFDPSDLTAIDPELGELGRPEWAGNASVQWSYGAFSLRWQTTYQDTQALRGVEIETATELYGEGVALSGDIFIHDLNASYDLNENIRFYGGVNNLTGEEPFSTENAFPVSARGRTFFLGVNASF